MPPLVWQQEVEAGGQRRSRGRDTESCREKIQEAKEVTTAGVHGSTEGHQLDTSLLNDGETPKLKKYQESYNKYIS